MKKILYITTTKYPSPMANYLQTLISANELADNFSNVTFITQRKIPPGVFADYGIAKNDCLRIKIVAFDTTLNRLTFIVQIFFMAILGRFGAIYSREKHLLPYLNFLPIPLFTEVHAIDKYTKKIPRRTRIIATTNSIKKALVRDYGFNEKRIHITPNGVYVENFDIPISKQKAKEELRISGNMVILYSGHLYQWKGAQVLAEAAKLLPDFLFLFVGGNEIDIHKFREKYPYHNIRIEGRKPHNQIPKYLKASDVLVLPNSPSTIESMYYTSPIKLFEYMASKRPIVASDLPSIREILDETRTAFFRPDDPNDTKPDSCISRISFSDNV